MAGLLEMILGSQDGSNVQEIAQKLGIDERQAKSAIGELLPALKKSLSNQTSTQSGVESLAQALGRGNHQKYLQTSTSVADESAQQDGNAILGHLFGSKEVSRQVASLAAQRTGLDQGLLKKMLPMVATMAMGALGQKSDGGTRLQPQASGAEKEDQGFLSSLLDSDGDGSMADDLFNIAKGLF